MREYTATFDAFNKGLRPTEDVAKNTEVLTSARGLKPVIGGAVSIKVPKTVPITAVWPLPQLFKTSAGILVATRTTLQRFNADGTLTVLLSGSASGSWWDIADYMDYIVATNGSATIIYNPVTFVWEVYAGIDLPIVGTLCDFNGQLIMGDLPTTWAAGTDSNWIAWSKIGAAEARLDAVDDSINVAGIAPMRWEGPVYKVKKLGQHVMVYGENGITPIMPADAPAVTWGIPRRNMFDFGIASRRAVTGDDSEHYFVDSRGYLWRITDNHAITNFDYHEFLAPMLGTDLVLSFDPITREVYICNDVIGYILTPQGLGGPIDFLVSDAVYSDGYKGLIIGAPLPYIYDTCQVELEPQDFGVREIKNTGWINVTQKGAATTEVAVATKYDKASAVYTQSAWVPTNAENSAFIRMAGTDHKIFVRFTNFEKVLISKLAYSIQVPDRRFTRGARGGRGEQI